jgi:hypothetical protein
MTNRQSANRKTIVGQTTERNGQPQIGHEYVAPANLPGPIVSMVGSDLKYNDTGQQLTIEDLIAIAESRNPTLQQASQHINAAMGKAIQAGLYPQKMLNTNMDMETMMRVWQPREMQGMRATAAMSMNGLMTSMRVLPADLFDRVMNSNEEIEKGSIFAEIVKRFGNPADYRKAPRMDMPGAEMDQME